MSQPAPQRVASAQPMAVAPSAPAAADPGATGAFSVQLGVSPSEAEARTTFQKLQQKYADLSGRGSMIRKADVNGATVYRVRVGPMSRDDASSLCSKLQGQGGQCFVAKN
jgi:cell division septation protein DedD